MFQISTDSENFPPGCCSIQNNKEIYEIKIPLLALISHGPLAVRNIFSLLTFLVSTNRKAQNSLYIIHLTVSSPRVSVWSLERFVTVRHPRSRPFRTSLRLRPFERFEDGTHTRPSWRRRRCGLDYHISINKIYRRET